MLFIALFCTLFSTIFNYTLSLMASPYIVSDLGGSNEIGIYTVSFFALGNALGVPLGKALLPRIGAPRFLITAILLFTFFSWTCAVSPTFPILNVSRFLQGFVSGPFYALVFYLLSKLQPQGKKALFTSIALTIFTAGPVIGACWGGWIAYEWNWRWAFYFNIPLLLLIAGVLWYFLRDFKDEQEKKEFDGVGYFFFCLGVFCVSTAAIMGQELDWQRSPLVLTLGAIGIPSLLFFVFWEINHLEPILDLKALKSPALFFALFNLAILFSVYFGMVVLLSLWLKLWVNYTPDWIATLLSIMALTALIPLFLINTKMGKADNRIFLALSIVFLVISCVYTMVFNVEIDFGRIATSRLFAGLGLSLFLAPILRLCIHAFPKEQMLQSMSLFQVTRALSSGLGASVYNIIWQRRQVFFHDRLGSSVTALSPQTQEFFSKAKTIGLQGEFADAQLEYYLQRQATALALDDCFYLMALILTGLLISYLFTFLAKKGSFITE